MVVCTGPFLVSANLHARVLGRPEFPPVVIQHPLGGIGPEDVKQRAAAAEDQIIAALTKAE